MKNFNRENRSGGGRGDRKFGNRDFGNRGFSGRAQMHDAICSKCGNKCQVPFRPTGDKPIFCNNCFDKERGGGGGRDFGRKDFGGAHIQEKRMYAAVCSKCGNKCEVPFLPTGNKQIYCSNCFGGITTTDRKDQASFSERKNIELYKEQFAAVNAKLDSILRVLEAQAVPEKLQIEPAQKIAKKPVKKATTPKKKKK